MQSITESLNKQQAQAVTAEPKSALILGRRRLWEDACLNKPHCLPASTEYGSSERDSCGDLYE